MSQDHKFPQKLRYEYKRDDDVRLNYAHGVWGGINPQGEIEINFYTESDAMPPYSERIIAEDGSFGHEIAPYDEDIRTITRTIHNRLLLNYQTARSVLEWLEEKIEMLEMEEGAAPLILDDDSGVEQ